MESVKKSINERALHKREYDKRVNERQIHIKEGKVNRSNALDASLVDTESRQQHTQQPEFNNKGEVDQNAEQCGFLMERNSHSSTTKVDNESSPSSNIDIINPHECKQTLDLSAGDSSKLNLPDHRYQDKDCQGRLLARFQDDAKYEHVGQDTRSQGGKDLKEKDLKISEL
ncbi:hypothetical protein Tco_0411083 [Tanacetum coccineum]